MTDIVDKTLEQAAASPDPKVRGMAIRYRKLQEEQEKLEGFFLAYQRVMGDTPAAPVVATKVVKERATVSSRSGTMATGKRGQVDAFIMRVCDMLVASGAPMALPALYEQFFQQNPDEDKPSQDTFRQRLTKKPHLIQSRDHKYWPTNQPFPEEGHSLAA